jgi:uncharacterized protein YggE
MENPLVSVRGEAFLSCEPEVAKVSVIVNARAKDRPQALSLLARRREEVSALLAQAGAAIERTEAGAAHVRPDFRDGKGKEQVTGYVASSRSSVTINDFTVLSDIVTSLVRLEMTEVEGPTWHLRPGSPQRRRARVLAAQDALTRAREYAEAFGTTVLELVELADLGLLSEQSTGNYRAAAMSSRGSHDYHDDEPSFDFQPVTQDVRGVVDARFTIAAPDLTNPVDLLTVRAGRG